MRKEEDNGSHTFQLPKFLYERSMVPQRHEKEMVQRKLVEYYSCVGISLQRHVKIGGLISNKKKAGIMGLDVCGNGRFVLSGCQNGTIHVHDILSLTGSQSKLQMGTDTTYYPSIASTTSNSSGSSIQSVEWYQKYDTGAFLSTQNAGYVSLWDANALTAVVQLSIPNQLLHSSYCPSTITCAVVLHPQQIIQLWNMAQGTTTHTLPSSSSLPTRVLWHPTLPHYLLSGDTSGNVHLWDIRKPKSHLCNLCQYYSPHAGEPISHLTITSNGHSLLTTSSTSNTITHWNLSQIMTTTTTTNNNNNTLSRKPYYDTSYVCRNNGGGRIQNMSLLNDTTIWMTQEEQLHGYSLEKGNLPQKSLKGHLDTITSLVTTTTTFQILTGSKDGMILSWGTTTNQNNHDYNNNNHLQYPYTNPHFHNQNNHYDCWD